MVTEPEHTDKPEKYRRPWRPMQVIFATLAVCIILVILCLLTITGGTPNVTFNYTERYNELFRPPDFNEADNAADLYNLAFASFREIPSTLTDAIAFRWEIKWPGELDEQTRSALADWLNSNEKAFEYARLAARKPFYWNVRPATGPSPWGGDWLDFGAMQNLANAFILQALFHAFNDRHAEAFAKLETVFCISKHYAGPRVLMEQLSAVRFRTAACVATLCILANSQPPPQLLAQFQAFLEERGPLPPLSFAAEQLAAQWYIERRFTDDGRGNGRIIINESNGFPNTHHYGPSARPDWRELLDYLRERSYLIFQAGSHDDRRTTTEKAERLYALLAEIADETPFELKSRGTSHSEEVEKIIGKGQELFLQTWSSSGRFIELNKQRGNDTLALAAVIAAMRYKADAGEYPETLRDLQSAGYLAVLPQDPYSDQPLVYRRTDDGFTLYSVGRDFTDDGGLKHQWYSAKSGEDYIYWPVPVREASDSAYPRFPRRRARPPDPNAPPPDPNDPLQDSRSRWLN